MKIDYQKQAQLYYSKGPLIILGSGASATHGLSGMGALAQHLIAKTDLVGMSQSELLSWKNFCDLLTAGIDLETALHQISISEELTSKVISSTWNLINAEDLNAFKESIANRTMFPLSRLLAHMFKSSLKMINVVTTNYDRLAEYACEQERLHHYTGFTYGSYRHLSAPNEITSPRRVNIWKVHGSLDWFRSPTREIVALSHFNQLPENHDPQIVTPGRKKYQRTHLEPYRSIINNADQAITAANSYLCIGYGFNDEHIQPKLIGKCLRENTPVTIISRSLSKAVTSLIINGSAKNYLAIERGASDDESIVHSSQTTSPIKVPGQLWSLNGYLTMVI